MYTQIFCLLLCITLIYATSSGIDIYLCDINSPLWGCDPNNWPNQGRTEADRKLCSNKTNIMSWVSWPVRSEDFLFFVGDSENYAPPATYTPGEYFNVGVMKLNYEMRFRGLFIYAVDANEDKVGEWYIYNESPEIFHAPMSSCPQSVFHAGAAVKEGEQIFAFKAPEGTGPITFRVLVKEGDANTGAFYLPNLEDITLQEGSPSNTNDEWELTEFGQSCRDYCEAKGEYCDTSKLIEISSETALDEITEDHPCKFPYLSSCEVFGPARGENDLCYYQDTEAVCTAEEREYTVPECQIEAPGKQRLCVCATDESEDSDFRVGDNTTEVSAGSMMKFAWSMLAVLFLMHNPKRTSVLIVAILVIICMSSPVEGHNWVNSPSRSLVASTHKPFLPKSSNKPHVQVGPGQEFQIEYMTGHDSRLTYFILVQKEHADEGLLTNHRFDLLDQYLADALAAGAVNYANTEDGQRLHRKSLTADGLAMGYHAKIEPGHNQYIERPAAFTQRPNTGQSLWSYNSTHRASDIRVIYDHPEFPWIISMDKFSHTFGLGGEYDVVRMKIPEGLPFGKYIVQYMWAGYYDAIDVDYIDQQVEHIYGEDDPSIRTTFSRIDHCYFPEVIRSLIYNPAGRMKAVLNRDPTVCLEKCRTKADECKYVQVVPLRVPDAVRDDWKEKAGHYQVMDLEHYNSTYNELLEFLPEDDAYICYDVGPRAGSETEGRYVISLDPEDPVFYSTCYIANDKLKFIGYEDSEPEPIETPYIFNGKCLDCDAHAAIKASDTLVPVWKWADKCRDCDAEGPDPANFIRPKIKYALAKNNSYCDGGVSQTIPYPGDSYGRAHHKTCAPASNISCVKRMHTPGTTTTAERTTISLATCAALVAADPECSPFFSKYVAAGQDPEDYNHWCFCYKKLSCCHGCSPRYAGDTNPWMIYEVATGDFEADPFCENGEMSLDRKHCCSKSCGPGQCRPTGSELRHAYGFCTSDMIYRSCEEFSAPCNIERDIPEPTNEFI